MKILKNSTYKDLQDTIKILKNNLEVIEENRIFTIKVKTANFQKLLADKDVELLKLKNENDLLKWQIKNPSKFKITDVVNKHKIIAVKTKENSHASWALKGFFNILDKGFDFAIANAKPFEKYYYEYLVAQHDDDKKRIISKSEKELVELQETTKTKKKK